MVKVNPRGKKYPSSPEDIRDYIKRKIEEQVKAGLPKRSGKPVQLPVTGTNGNHNVAAEGQLKAEACWQTPTTGTKTQGWNDDTQGSVSQSYNPLIMAYIKRSIEEYVRTGKWPPPLRFNTTGDVQDPKTEGQQVAALDAKRWTSRNGDQQHPMTESQEVIPLDAKYLVYQLETLDCDLDEEESVIPDPLELQCSQSGDLLDPTADCHVVVPLDAKYLVNQLETPECDLDEEESVIPDPPELQCNQDGDKPGSTTECHEVIPPNPTYYLADRTGMVDYYQEREKSVIPDPQDKDLDSVTELDPKYMENYWDMMEDDGLGDYSVLDDMEPDLEEVAGQLDHSETDPFQIKLNEILASLEGIEDETDSDDDDDDDEIGIDLDTFM